MVSSVIADIDYDSKTGITTVVFVSGKSYDYTSIPEDVVNEWKNASSLGEFFNSRIKGQYK